MDLMQLTNTLKNLSDEQLSSVQQSAQVPPYVVVAEMKRRDEIRKEYQASQDGGGHRPSVASELAAKFAQSQVPAPPPQQGPPQGGPPPMMQGPPGGIMQAGPGGPGPMARGGIVGLAGGGPADGPALTAADIDQRYPVPDMNQVLAQVQAMRGPDTMAPIAAELAQESAKYRNKKISPWEAISRAGFAMAAAPTSSFGSALGVAGLAGLNDVQQQRDDNHRQYTQFLQDRMRVALAQQSSQDRDMGSATDLYRSGTARADSMAGIIEPNRRLAQQYEQEAPQREAALAEARSLADYHKAQAAKLNRDDVAGLYAERLKQTNPLMSEVERNITARKQADADSLKMDLAKQKTAGDIQVAAARAAAQAYGTKTSVDEQLGQDYLNAVKRNDPAGAKVALDRRSAYRASGSMADETSASNKDTRARLAAEKELADAQKGVQWIGKDMPEETKQAIYRSAYNRFMSVGNGSTGTEYHAAPVTSGGTPFAYKGPAPPARR